MNRRRATLSLAGAIVVLLAVVAWVLPVPYVVEAPGPTENTLGVVQGKQVVQVEGHPTYPTAGSLDLVTVSFTAPESRLHLLAALGAWIDPTIAVVPRSYIYPPGQTITQVEQQNAEEMQSSQQNAPVAALRELGIKVPQQVVVAAILKGAPALGHLKAGDAILAVDGTAVRSPAQVGQIVGAHRPGEQIRFEVERNGRRLTVPVTAGTTPGDSAKARVGIEVGTDFKLPFDITINLGQDIGGPSAGTMFALAIVDKLTPGYLNGGKKIAGTGEISPTGQVGPIGGIQQKIAAARSTGAQVFLVPADNCKEALGARRGSMRLVKITTLGGAVQSLEKLAKGDTDVPACTR